MVDLNSIKIQLCEFNLTPKNEKNTRCFITTGKKIIEILMSKCFNLNVYSRPV